MKDNDDPFITNADIAVDQFSKSAKPGAFLVDFIPWCTFYVQYDTLNALATRLLTRCVSEICTRVVPRHAVEAGSQSLEEGSEHDGGRTSQFREKSDGKLRTFSFPCSFPF